MYIAVIMHNASGICLQVLACTNVVSLNLNTYTLSYIYLLTYNTYIHTLITYVYTYTHITHTQHDAHTFTSGQTIVQPQSFLAGAGEGLLEVCAKWGRGDHLNWGDPECVLSPVLVQPTCSM